MTHSQATTGRFENFQLRQFNLPNGIHINARVANGAPSPARPALFLLHGFPQTHVCWRRVAYHLQDEYFLVLPDLRGYGGSAQPPGEADHSNYSKRELAADVVAIADELGIQDFFLCGHDRGGRVAHRLALDHPQRVRRLCVWTLLQRWTCIKQQDLSLHRPTTTGSTCRSPAPCQS